MNERTKNGAIPMGTVQQLKPQRQKGRKGPIKISDAMQAYLERGTGQPGGKLPLFDAEGQKVNERTVQSCLDRGLVEPWFINPLKPDFMVCRLTPAGYEAIGARVPKHKRT